MFKGGKSKKPTYVKEIYLFATVPKQYKIN